MMDWSNELIFEFLDLYEQEDIIWNPKNPDYKNRTKVAEAWDNISKRLTQEMSVNALKKKKEGLMATYRSLNQKVQQSKKPGIGIDEFYRPSWFCYYRMHAFLQDVYKPKLLIDTENLDMESQSDTERTENLLDDITLTYPCEGQVNEGQVNVEDDENSGRQSSTTSVRKTFKSPQKRNTGFCTSCSEETIEETQLDKGYSILKTVTRKPNEKKDECDVYGELIATKLRKLDEQTRDVVMNNIDNLIFRAKMGHTNSQYIQIMPSQNLPSSSSSHSHPVNIKLSPSHSHLCETSIDVHCHNETLSP